ncbi:ABC transporter ATP-binding protein [Candidatus Zixiibacteriota bacterium]
MSNPKTDPPAADRARILLSARGVQKSYRTGSTRLDVLTGIDLEIRPGEITAIVGASGVGKSTLLHILGALDKPTGGRVDLNGADIFSLSDKKLARVRNETFGFVFQFHHLLPDFSALENVFMPPLISGRSRAAARQTALDLLAEVGLARCAEQKPGQLSGGEQQRVAVARALANAPAVILADEPSGNLDRANSEMLHDLIYQLSRSKNQAFVIVTHNEKLASRADRMFRMIDGKLQPEIGL